MIIYTLQSSTGAACTVYFIRMQLPILHQHPRLILWHDCHHLGCNLLAVLLHRQSDPPCCQEVDVSWKLRSLGPKSLVTGIGKNAGMVAGLVAP